MANGCKICGDVTDFNEQIEDYNIYCYACEDIIAERYAARREWAEFHPGEPCPEEELPPLPRKK